MKNIIAVKDSELFLNTYNRLPIDISHGKGVYLYDKSGKKYLDFFSGLAVNALGYAHPEIVEAVTNQIQRFAHLSNNFLTDIQIEFTELLLKHSRMSKAFLTNSGTESVEAAIKLVRKIKGPDKIIYSLSNGFHGRTYGAVSLTAKEKYRKGFEPLLPNTAIITFNDVNELKQNVNENTAAVFTEFIQGEGGINCLTKEYVDVLNDLRNKFGFIIVSDSIQCGIGRTGDPFSHDHYNFTPDLIVTAKAIGGGLPLGALLVSDKLSSAFETGTHGTTFGGNPVCCAAGKVVLKKVFEEGLIDSVRQNGKLFIERLNVLKSKYSVIKEIRGRGYMIGVEMKNECSEIVTALRERFILVNCTNNNVIRILPPLIAEIDHINLFLYEFEKVIQEIEA
ncbi:MAG: acetylornithine/succinylornithine family transaminase [Ignavibacteriales bacterium]|nr:MAG: acetylornithine/succinylornithine family transaminase [Ignavibacteriales bacterium]